jgi:hypothetical protein
MPPVYGGLGLCRRGAEGVPDVIELLDQYGMSRDDVMEVSHTTFFSNVC